MTESQRGAIEHRIEQAEARATSVQTVEEKDALLRELAAIAIEVRRIAAPKWRSAFGQQQNPQPAMTMRAYVKLYRDGENLAIATNCVDEAQFVSHVAAPFAQVIATCVNDFESNALVQGYLPQIIDICCKMRGYKAPMVEEQRVLMAGRLGLSDSAVIASAEQPGNPVIAHISPEAASA